jgi:hypothetical protein
VRLLAFWMKGGFGVKGSLLVEGKLLEGDC